MQVEAIAQGTPERLVSEASLDRPPTDARARSVVPITSRCGEAERPCLFCADLTLMVRLVGVAPPVVICRPCWLEVRHGVIELPRLGYARPRRKPRA